jgi:hypothetical protein
MKLMVEDTLGNVHEVVSFSEPADGKPERWFLNEGLRELVKIDDRTFMVTDQPNAAPLKVVSVQ